MPDEPLQDRSPSGASGSEDRSNGASSEEGVQDVEMEELRRLLLGWRADEIANLQARLDQIAALKEKGQMEAVSKVLPRAISRYNPNNTPLVNALGPTIEKTIDISIRRNPRPFVDAIFPVIGPAIRRSIQEALKSVMDSINRTLEHGFSLQSLKWRIEAARTGRKYSEVVMAYTLAHRVEQLFLIDRATGLPIQHLSDESVEMKDSDIISSMLNAIQSFVRDSLGADRDDVVETIEVGDVSVLIEPGPRAILAAVVRGIPTADVRETMKHIIEAVHLQYYYLLDNFEGDPTPFMPLQPLLRTGFSTQFKEKERSSRGGLIMFGLLGLAVLVWGIMSVINYLHWTDYVADLKDEPGIVVTETGRRAGRWVVEGLLDPLATRPETLIPQALSSERVLSRWEPYLALDSTMIVRRAARLLQAPEGVTFTLHGDTLSLSGAASSIWLQQARARASYIPGILVFQDAQVNVRENQELMDALALVERTTVTFDQGSADILPQQAIVLDSLASAMLELAGHSLSEGIQFRVHLIGHASTEGSEAINRSLSQMRAESVRVALVERGVAEESISTVGTGNPIVPGEERSEADREHNRSVTFLVSQF